MKCSCGADMYIMKKTDPEAEGAAVYDTILLGCTNRKCENFQKITQTIKRPLNTAAREEMKASVNT